VLNDRTISEYELGCMWKETAVEICLEGLNSSIIYPQYVTSGLWAKFPNWKSERKAEWQPIDLSLVYISIIYLLYMKAQLNFENFLLRKASLFTERITFGLVAKWTLLFSTTFL
jgi:hypothetical protein